MYLDRPWKVSHRDQALPFLNGDRYDPLGSGGSDVHLYSVTSPGVAVHGLVQND